MANAYSTADLVKGTLQRCGELTDGTSPLHQLALKFVNRAYSDILKGNSVFAPEVREVWTWARQTATLVILANYNSGSVTFTTGSTAGTFSVAPTVSLVGYNLQIVNQPNSQMVSWYKIATHTASSTAFTLDFQYVEASGTYSFNAIPLTVDLGRGVLRLAEPLRQYNTRILELGELPADMGRIYFVEYNKFWEKYPLELLLNDIPSRFTVESSSDTSYVLRFNKWPSNPMRVDYDYISTQPLLVDASTSVPLVPFEDRDVLEIMASYYLFLDKKQPMDADNSLKLAAQRILAMKLASQGQQKLGKIFGELIPRLDDTAVPYWLIQQR